MNKLSLTIVAFAALSSAAYANNRGYDLRDSDACTGKYCNNVTKPFISSKSPVFTVVSPLAVDEKDRPLSNYERMMNISKENEIGGH